MNACGHTNCGEGRARRWNITRCFSPKSLLSLASEIEWFRGRWLRARHAPLLRYSLLLSVLAAPFTLLAQRYIAIDVKMETLGYRFADLAQARNAIRRDYAIHCIVGKNQWRIDVPETNAEEEWYFDGSHIYMDIITTNSHPQLLGQRPQNAGPQPTPQGGSPTNSDQIVSTVNVWGSVDGCPLSDIRANIPWLAFCSGPYLKQAHRLVPFPVVDLRHAPDGFAYYDKTVAFDDDFGLPRSIELFASERLFEESVTNGPFEGNHDVSVWKRGSMGFKWDLPEGTLRFQYVVNRATNVMGWNVPLSFQWFLGVPGAENLVPLGHGEVNSLRESEGPSPVLGKELHQTIVDWRFVALSRGVRGILYPSQSSVLPPTNDSRLQRVFESQKTLTERLGQRRGARPVLVLAVLLLALPPFMLLFARSLNKRAQRKANT
jgi:hypothetical protein